MFPHHPPSSCLESVRVCLTLFSKPMRQPSLANCAATTVDSLVGPRGLKEPEGVPEGVPEGIPEGTWDHLRRSSKETPQKFYQKCSVRPLWKPPVTGATGHQNTFLAALELAFFFFSLASSVAFLFSFWLASLLPSISTPMSRA